MNPMEAADKGDAPLIQHPLGLSHPAVALWFAKTFRAPTEAQSKGWAAIAQGQNALIAAPTGSGKTLAAFLSALDFLWTQPRTKPGVRILYVSPLKALNVDIARNLENPLGGIIQTSRELGNPLEPLRLAVRTGDTPTTERERFRRHPSDILITTPESLHLLLTSKAREALQSLSHVIIDEVHALAPNKRGAFLALLLERLEAINPAGFVRIGLSATMRPLEVAARFLGGYKQSPGGQLLARPVTIVDATRSRDFKLSVSYPPASHFGTGLPTWEAIELTLRDLILENDSTIVFVNNRRVAERLTARLNEKLAGDEAGTDESPESVHSHHGSLSLDRRRATESRLKAGELKAVVATASLELGIDMEAVDAVALVESPGSVSRALQRIGRAGHHVGGSSQGHLLAKSPGDLLECAALARCVRENQIESVRVPANCLDVLAQQVVACVAMDSWEAPRLYQLIRGAEPYRGLSQAAFQSVLELVSGRFEMDSFRDLRPRISWDRLHNRLHSLPGSARLALTGGGTIPDTGQYPVHLGENGPRLGELDEEFVLERRVGECFVLGSSTWRIESIDTLRVVVTAAQGNPAQMPFWRGEQSHRTLELGKAVGALARVISDRLDDPGLLPWLEEHHDLDHRSASLLRDFVKRQKSLAGAVPDNSTLIVESFRDPTGELGLAVLSPFGGRFHHALRLALFAEFRKRLGITITSMHGNDGILFRLPGCDEPPRDLLASLNEETVEELIRQELGFSALFGLRFRQIAGRALLLPRPDPSRRAPLWLQRLRAKDLLQAVRQVPDFPLVLETYRECLADDLDVPFLREVLAALRRGEMRVVERHGEIPSPFASSLVFAFSAKFLYEWDDPKQSPRSSSSQEVSADRLEDLLDPSLSGLWLDPAAIQRVEARLRGSNLAARTPEELAEHLRRLGDLTPAELEATPPTLLESLKGQGRALEVILKGVSDEVRWINSEDAPLYLAAFGERITLLAPSQNQPEGQPVPSDDPLDSEGARARILQRFVRTRALVGLDDLARRYPIDRVAAEDFLGEYTKAGGLVRLEPDPESDGEIRWSDRRNLEEVRRLSLALRRKEAVAVAPEVYADFLLRRHQLIPQSGEQRSRGLPEILGLLSGFPAPASLWETDLLPRRLANYQPSQLDEALGGGGWFWRAYTEGAAEPGESAAVTFFPRDFPGPWAFGQPEAQTAESLPESARRVLELLLARGPSFVDELTRTLAIEPSAVRTSLEILIARGLVSNDRFDPLREGGKAGLAALRQASRRSERREGSALSSRSRLGSFRRPLASRVEGRWLALQSPSADPETQLMAWAAVLLDRHAVLCRDTAGREPWGPSWRELYHVLDRAEMRGEVKRGYFVEGLSGIQYAWPDTAYELGRHVLPADAESPILISSLDPANLYGAGAPLDISLLEGGNARLLRASGNHLVLSAGRPVLIIEAWGKRLTGLPTASERELRAALGLVSGLAGPSRRILRIDSFNQQPILKSPAAEWLVEHGFVRDPSGLAFYFSGW